MIFFNKELKMTCSASCTIKIQIIMFAETVGMANPKNEPERIRVATPSSSSQSIPKSVTSTHEVQKTHSPQIPKHQKHDHQKGAMSVWNPRHR